MKKYFIKLSVKADGNPEQDGTYSTNKRQLQFKSGVWYDCGSEISPPEFYFQAVSPDNITAYKWLKEKGISSSQIEMSLTSNIQISENAFSSQALPLISLMEEFACIKLIKTNDTLAFTEWFEKNCSGSMALGFYMLPNQLERFTIKELYIKFKQQNS